MTTNEVLAKQNFITKIKFKDGDAELSRELKVKIMGMRIEYSKIRRAFDADLQEFAKELVPEEFNVLNAKPDKTEEDNKKLEELTKQINEDYNSYVNTRGQEEVQINNKSFTEDEYNEIVAVNAGNDVEINGQKLSSADFLEIFYSLFVTE